MISLKDIAAACNVSVATVSKALNDQHDVSVKTKELVRQKAKELGYFPNSAAKMLKTNESRNIGVLFVDETQSGLTHDYFNHVLDSFKRGIEKYDYDLTLINCSKGQSQQMTYLERARYRGFDGIAIACIDFQDPEVPADLQHLVNKKTRNDCFRFLASVGIVLNQEFNPADGSMFAPANSLNICIVFKISQRQ